MLFEWYNSKFNLAFRHGNFLSTLSNAFGYLATHVSLSVIKIFLHFIFQALDGFVIVLTREFEVFYASETVQDYLGLAQVHLTSYT